MARMNGKAKAAVDRDKATDGNGHGGTGLTEFQVRNALTMISRAALIRSVGTDPRRDIDDECGYPKTPVLMPGDFQDLYEREPVAGRVVDIHPDACFAARLWIVEDNRAGTETEFEGALRDLEANLLAADNLPGHEQTADDEKVSPLVAAMHEADQLRGVGRFGAMLLGLDDGKDPREPAEPRAGQQLLFLRSFTETHATVAAWDMDPKSRRCGRPLAYNLTLVDPEGGSSLGYANATIEAHWTRVIHMRSDRSTTGNPILGDSRMLGVLNPLLDIRKVRGGSGEMFWKGAFPGTSFETQPQLGGEVEVDKDAFRDMVENWANGLQRHLVLTGMTARQLSPSVADPTPHILVHVQAICIRIDCPMRIFLGSERGELASSQDLKDWHDSVLLRQRRQVTPRIVQPVIERLIALKVLPKPKRWQAVWEPLDALSALEKMQVAAGTIDALAKYQQGGVDQLIQPMDVLTRLFDWDDDEAEAVLKEAEKAAADQQEEAQAMADEQGFVPAPPDGFQPPPPPPGQQPGKQPPKLAAAEEAQP